MRNIDGTILEYMRTEYGLESVLVVRVYWNDSTYVDYSDKANETYGIQGKVLDLSDLDDVIGIDTGGNSVQINVSLDDSDGTIKSIIGTIDTHKRRVQILQWFTGLPFNQAFPIFNGLMNTPMEWSEGERTFKFSVLNLVENLEIGFSMDEGFFQNLPVTIAGKAFPMVFGRALMVPSLIIGASPSGLLARGLGLIYSNTFKTEKDALSASLKAARQLARDQSALYGAAVLTAGQYNDGRDDSGQTFYREGINTYQFTQMTIDARVSGISITIPEFQVGNPPDDYGTYQQYFNAAEQHRGQELKYEAEMDRISAQIFELDRQRQQLEALGTDPINGATIITIGDDTPAAGGIGAVSLASLNYSFSKSSGGQINPFHVEMNGTFFLTRAPTQSLNSTVLGLLAEELPPNLRPYDPYFALYKDAETSRKTQSTKTSVKFKWFDAGTRVRFLDVPVYYLACYGANSKVTGVWAKARGMKVPVPAGYYQVNPWSFSNSNGNAAVGQVVTMTLALTSILDAAGQNIYDSDEIWCDIVGEVDSNYANILTYILTLFSTLQIDAATFAAAQSYTFNNPMNFVLFERKPVLDFVRELSFQAKTAVWIDDRTVKLRYLSAEYPGVDTITPDDLVEDSLVITSTATEELVTKMVGHWKSNFDQQTENSTTLRYNLLKYGLHTDEINYYAFNVVDLIQRSLAFWVVRKGTVWKRIRFKTFLDKINLESHDVVTFSGFEGYFSCRDVKGVIESAVYNSSNNTITFEAWLPIRWGEMCQTPYAYPSDQETFFGAANNPDFLTGNPFQGASDSNQFIEDRMKLTYRQQHAQPPLTKSSNFSMQDNPISITPDTAVAYVPINPIRPDAIERANDKNTYDLKELPKVTIDDSLGNADIGTVLNITDTNQTYVVQLQNTKTTILAKQQLIADGYRVADGSVVYLIRKKGKWLMQHPVWSREVSEDSGGGSGL